MNEQLKFSELRINISEFKIYYLKKKDIIINWKSLEKQNLNDTINALAMTSPFSIRGKNKYLLESQEFKKLEKIKLLKY